MSKTSRMNKAREAKAKAQDTQAPLSGKVENDFNKRGSDRESQVGSHNQSRERQSSPNSGEMGRNS